MNAIQLFVVRLAARIAPPLRRVLRSAGGTVERLEESNLMLRDMLDDRRVTIQREMQDLREALAMVRGGYEPVAIAEASRGETFWRDQVVSVKESQSSAVVQCVERLAELELALEDRGWKRQLAIGDMEFSRYGLQQIILFCRLYRIKNPIIQRGILVGAYYVFGRGVEVSSDDDAANQVLQDFFDDPRNAAELGHSALCAKEASLYTDGNIFWTFFSDPNDGTTQVRTIDPIEIEEIICNPDDHAQPWFYHRRWTKQNFDIRTGNILPEPAELWYVDLRYDGPKVTEIKGKPVAMDPKTHAYIPVLHRKDGGLEKWHFGLPRAYAALDWARAYKSRLEDYATIARALARFAWGIETQGGQPAIAAFKQTLATTLGNNTDMIEQNPPPTVASTWITGPGNKLTPMNTAGRQANPEEGRRLAHMAYMVFGLPETFFADVSVGTLATATSLDRPTQLKFMRDQESWAENLKIIGMEVLKRSATAANGKLREVYKDRKVTFHMTPARVHGETMWFHEAAAKPKDAGRVTVDVKFPAILEGDIPARVGAIVEAMTLNGFDPTGIDIRTGLGLLMTELGVEDAQGVLEEQLPEAQYKAIINRIALLKAQQEQAMAPPPTPGGEVPAVGAPPHAPMPRKPRPKRIDAKENALIVAVRDLRNAMKGK